MEESLETWPFDEVIARVEKLEAALKEYIGGCTNEECIYCINARQALGETQ